MPTVGEFTKSVLALRMWRERSPDGLQGMTAIGMVMRNRVQAGWHGSDWIQVISHLGDDPPGVSWPWPDTRDPAFLAVLRKADTIYDGTEPDPTNGALYYANLSTPDLPESFLENIVRKPDQHARLGTVGQFTFFA